MKKLIVLLVLGLSLVANATPIEYAEYSLDNTWVGFHGGNNDFGNQSGSTWVEIQGGLDNEPRTQRMIIKNDLSSIPAGSTIVSATLTMYGINHGGPGGTVELYAIEPTAAWTTSGASWNTMDGTNPWPTSSIGEVGDDNYGAWLTPGVLDSAVITGSTKIPQLPFDVTSVVQEWVDGTRVNQGFVLTWAAGLDASSYFYWYNNNATGGAPGAGTRLSVLYIPEPATVSLMVLGACSLILRRRK